MLLGVGGEVVVERLADEVTGIDVPVRGPAPEFHVGIEREADTDVTEFETWEEMKTRAAEEDLISQIVP